VIPGYGHIPNVDIIGERTGLDGRRRIGDIDNVKIFLDVQIGIVPFDKDIGIDAVEAGDAAQQRRLRRIGNVINPEISVGADIGVGPDHGKTADLKIAEIPAAQDGKLRGPQVDLVHVAVIAFRDVAAVAVDLQAGQGCRAVLAERPGSVQGKGVIFTADAGQSGVVIERIEIRASRLDLFDDRKHGYLTQRRHLVAAAHVENIDLALERGFDDIGRIKERAGVILHVVRVGQLAPVGHV